MLVQPNTLNKMTFSLFDSIHKINQTVVVKIAGNTIGDF